MSEPRRITHFINGAYWNQPAQRTGDVYNPALGQVTGKVDFVDSDGKVLETKENFSLCRCGHSKEKPYCDGSHRDAGFQG